MEIKDTDRPSFFKWITHPQMLVGLSALLLSFCGLFIAIYEASLIRQAQRASVWPHVEVVPSTSQDTVKLIVQNTGVGPARIRAAAVTYEGETLAGWSELIRRTTGEEPDGFYRNLINGRVLSGDSPQEVIFRVSGKNGAAARATVPPLGREILEGTVDVTVCYCSVYDECWTTSMQDVLGRLRGEAPRGTQEVSTCDAAEHSGI